MRIGGVVPCSLSDFPGRIAAVVFTQGCNWRCPWCHNPALVYPEQFTFGCGEAEVLARLSSSRRKIDGVVVTGGEPTLQPDLAAFLGRIKGLGFETKLDTNGSRPEVVRALLEAHLVDFVAMDIKAPWSRYGEAAGTAVAIAQLEETLTLLRTSGIAYQFRTTRWPGLTAADEAIIAAVVRRCPHVWQEYRLPSPEWSRSAEMKGFN